MSEQYQVEGAIELITGSPTLYRILKFCYFYSKDLFEPLVLTRLKFFNETNVVYRTFMDYAEYLEGSDVIQYNNEHGGARRGQRRYSPTTIAIKGHSFWSKHVLEACEQLFGENEND